MKPNPLHDCWRSVKAVFELFVKIFKFYEMFFAPLVLKVPITTGRRAIGNVYPWRFNDKFWILY